MKSLELLYFMKGSAAALHGLLRAAEGMGILLPNLHTIRALLVTLQNDLGDLIQNIEARRA